MGVPDPALDVSAREAATSGRGVSAEDATRDSPEPSDPYRTPFQRDRDRILHTKAFRRLKHKTQVFIAPGGDHYRTRLTHTLEVTAISRTIARALDLNEDLTEAIGMGHDLGHAPFGHAGEAALDEVLSDRFERRFRHNLHSVRVVEVLEGDRPGLNLTHQVRDGIANHTGSGRPATLEGQIVRISDRFAYINHDIDDSARAGLLDEADLPTAELAVLGQTPGERLDLLVSDLIENSRAGDEIRQSDPVRDAFLRLRKFMFSNVYLGPTAAAEADRAGRVVRDLFTYYLDHTDHLPDAGDADPVTRVTDFVAGMTDRYALRAHRELFLPSEGRL